MTAAQLKRAAIVLAVVLLLWVAAELLGGRGDRLETVRLAESLNATEVDTVLIESSEDTVRLVRTSSVSWTVNGYAAGSTAVDELFVALADSQEAALVAESPTSHGRMGVDSAGGKRLRIVHGDRTLVDLVVGKSGRAFQTVYVRPSGDDRVYLQSGRLGSLIARSVTDWRDKQIVGVEPDEVTRVTVERERRRYTIVRGDSAWTFSDGGATDSAEVGQLLDNFRSLRTEGVGFASDAQVDSADFVRPDRRVTLVSDGGDTLAALLFDSTAAGFWVRGAGGGAVYHLFRWKVDDITPVDSVLRGEK